MHLRLRLSRVRAARLPGLRACERKLQRYPLAFAGVRCGAIMWPGSLRARAGASV